MMIVEKSDVYNGCLEYPLVVQLAACPSFTITATKYVSFLTLALLEFTCIIFM